MRCKFNSKYECDEILLYYANPNWTTYPCRDCSIYKRTGQTSITKKEE